MQVTNKATNNAHVHGVIPVTAMQHTCAAIPRRKLIA
jgi:hypothetical protein